MATRLYLKARQAFRNYLGHRLPECRDLTRVMSESLDRRLTLRERVTLRLHLWVCLRCARYLSQISALSNVTRCAPELPLAEDTAPQLSDKARRRIKAALESERT